MSFIEQTTALFNQKIAGKLGAARFMRESAWEAFIQQGLPTRRVENWRYTPLRLLDQFTNEETANTLSIDALLATIPKTFKRIVMIDGIYRPELSNFDVTWSDQTAPATIDPIKHPMGVLNLAVADGGLELIIPAGMHIESPIAFLHISSALSSGKTHYFQHRIVLEAGAKATVVSYVMGTSPAQHANNILVQAQLAESASLGYYSANLSNNRAIHIEALHAEQHNGSQLDAFALAKGSRLSRIDFTTTYLGEQACAHLNGVYKTDNKQHIDIHVNAEHVAPHCSTHQLVRGIASDSSKAVFNGRVCVHKNAVKSFSQQSNHNLLLSKTAEIDTKPELEIYNDDVKCAHGATVGQLDSDALFYLMARGIDEQHAKAMLIRAFVSQQFELIQNTQVKEVFKTLFEVTL